MDKKRIGIYQIVCITNGKRYIGATTNLASRKRQHFSELRLNKHANPRLQLDFNNSNNDFIFSILEVLVDKNKLEKREQYWIDLLLPEYNAELKAGCSVNHVYNPEVKKKISNSVKKLWSDPEYRAKCSKPRNWKNGIPNRTGVKLSDETKEKIRQANLGKNNPHYGKPRSQEFLDKVRKIYPGVVSPDGEIYSYVIGLNKFCREHNLDSGQMSRLMSGKVQAYKGWKKLLLTIMPD